jgi:hypothetical protein
MDSTGDLTDNERMRRVLWFLGGVAATLTVVLLTASSPTPDPIVSAADVDSVWLRHS